MLQITLPCIHTGHSTIPVQVYLTTEDCLKNIKLTSHQTDVAGTKALHQSKHPTNSKRTWGLWYSLLPHVINFLILPFSSKFCLTTQLQRKYLTSVQEIFIKLFFSLLKQVKTRLHAWNQVFTRSGHTNTPQNKADTDSETLLTLITPTQSWLRNTMTKHNIQKGRDDLSG